ncbi:hypothetical protein P12x_002821 [Tundrisphaera lichenicola]|uniref:hypothetical protein n=1 Tax=Tundrisphaera lichenicola TaxID=2029860 RepID=UPI003EB703EB
MRVIGKISAFTRRVRMRARRRLGVVFALGVPALMAACFLVWWGTQLWGLPDLGDPLDLEASGTIDIPADRDAFVEYRHASSMLGRPWPKLAWTKTGEADPDEEWSRADPAWRGHVEANRDALSAWLRGTGRPEAIYHQPRDMTPDTELPVVEDIQGLARLASLEGTRLQEAGDLDGAWAWYLGILQSSRHVGRHGCMIERSIGVRLHELACRRLSTWAADPRVEAGLLREALDGVIAADALTPPASDGVKVEYRLFLRVLAEHGDKLDRSLDTVYSDPNGDLSGYWRHWAVPNTARSTARELALLLKQERERSLRVARLLAANWLAQVDKPSRLRARMAHHDPLIFESGPGDPPSSRALSPEALAGWYQSSFIARRWIGDRSRWLASLDAERARQARLVVLLASELHRRERGEMPASPEELVGPYLESLPEGFDAPEDAPIH